MDLRKLQNGSDVRGIALEGIEGEHINLTNTGAYKIAAAFVKWLAKKTGEKNLIVSVGRDSRLSGESLANSIMAGLCDNGNTKVLNFGHCTTPAMFMSTIDEMTHADGAIMITASHLPFNRNGMKFFTKLGGAEKEDIKEILTLANDINVKEDVNLFYEDVDFLSKYADGLVDKIREKTGIEKPFDGYKIIVDAGNGMGGFFADMVLEPLGADTKGSVYLDPDGNFPNHIPNPELLEVMDNFAKVVVNEKADLGIIFDTDVDRAAVVDKTGEEISRNKLVALMSAIVLEEAPGSYIVTDSVTSSGLKEFIEKRGGVHWRFKRGYKNVINEGIRLNKEGKECLLAIETSGHCALKENYFLDDGAYMIVKILIKFCELAKEGKDFKDLFGDLKEPLEATEMRGTFITEDFKSYGGKVLKDFEKYIKGLDGTTLEEPNFEGVRVIFNNNEAKGWVLMRLSLHDPVMPINIEADNKGGVKVIKLQVMEFLKQYDIKFK